MVHNHVVVDMKWDIHMGDDDAVHSLNVSLCVHMHQLTDSPSMETNPTKS